MTETNTLDLDEARAERSRARAARQEGRGETLPVIFGGTTIAVLGAEFPMSALEPLTGINVDIAYLVRAAVKMTSGTAQEQLTQTAGLLVDVLVANPQLPGQVIDAAKEVSRRILGDDGYAAFVALNPSPQDARALAQGLMSWYGVGLGESSASLPSSNDGGTLSPTSNGSTGSTPAASGDTPATPDSSASDGSSPSPGASPTTA